MILMTGTAVHVVCLIARRGSSVFHTSAEYPECISRQVHCIGAQIHGLTPASKHQRSFVGFLTSFQLLHPVHAHHLASVCDCLRCAADSSTRNGTLVSPTFQAPSAAQVRMQCSGKLYGQSVSMAQQSGGCTQHSPRTAADGVSQRAPALEEFRTRMPASPPVFLWTTQFRPAPPATRRSNRCDRTTGCRQYHRQPRDEWAEMLLLVPSRPQRSLRLAPASQQRCKRTCGRRPDCNVH
jgi:hypothetical protein